MTLRKLLDNKIIAITRKPADAKEFLDLVTSVGGRAIALPTIDIVPNLGAIKNALRLILVEEYDICIFMSPNAVRILFSYATKFDKREKFVSVLNTKTVVAQGPATKNILQKYGISVGQIPDKFSSEGIVSLFQRLDFESGKKVIIPRSGRSNDFVKQSLSNEGLDIIECKYLYTTTTATPGQIWNEFINLYKNGKVDALIFTSGSSVRSFFEILDKFSFNLHQFRLHSTAVISIGPLTTRTLQERRIYCIEASDHTIHGTFQLAKYILTGEHGEGMNDIR